MKGSNHLNKRYPSRVEGRVSDDQVAKRASSYYTKSVEDIKGQGQWQPANTCEQLQLCTCTGDFTSAGDGKFAI